jgi:hypothetical protein
MKDEKRLMLSIGGTAFGCGCSWMLYGLLGIHGAYIACGLGFVCLIVGFFL